MPGDLADDKPDVLANNVNGARPEYRSFHSPTKYPPKVDQEFIKDDKVWMKNPDTGIMDWSMFIVRAVDDNTRSDWVYVVKDTEGKVYGVEKAGDQPKLVSEKDLRER